MRQTRERCCIFQPHEFSIFFISVHFNDDDDEKLEELLCLNEPDSERWGERRKFRNFMEICVSCRLNMLVEVHVGCLFDAHNISVSPRLSELNDKHKKTLFPWPSRIAELEPKRRFTVTDNVEVWCQESENMENVKNPAKCKSFIVDLTFQTFPLFV